MSAIRTPENNQNVWLWFGLLSGPVVWAVHFLLIWAVTEMGCVPGAEQVNVISPQVIRIIVLLASALALLAMGAGVWAAQRRRRTLHEPHDNGLDPQETSKRAWFMVNMSLLLNPFFAAGVILEASALLVLPVCGGIGV